MKTLRFRNKIVSCTELCHLVGHHLSERFRKAKITPQVHCKDYPRVFCGYETKELIKVWYLLYLKNAEMRNSDMAKTYKNIFTFLIETLLLKF